MDLSALATLIAIVVAALAGLASLVAIAKANFAKTTIVTLKENNSALSDRVELLEGENARREQENAQQRLRIAALEHENDTLKTYVSGTEAIRELALSLAASDRTRASEHDDILAAVQLVPTVVTSGHTEVMALLRSHRHEAVA